MTNKIWNLLDKELRKTDTIECLDYTEYNDEYICSIDLYDIGGNGEDEFFEEVDNLINTLKKSYTIECKKWFECCKHKAEARIWISKDYEKEMEETIEEFEKNICKCELDFEGELFSHEN